MARGVNEELWYAVGRDRKAQAEAAKNLAQKVSLVVSAKSFPVAAQRLAQLTKNSDTTTDEFAKVLKSDPGLSTRLLRLVNSSGFALRAKCTSVEHALTLVGLEKLNQIATTAAIMDLYEETNGAAERVLEHATVVGALSRYLAHYLSLSPDDLFTCGFLHDLGKTMLLDLEGDDYAELLERAGDQFDRVHHLEQEKYGFDHGLLAGHVLAQWRIPNPIPKVIAWHHNIARAYADSNEVASMVSVVRLADAVSYGLLADNDALEIERIAKLEASSYLEITEAQLMAMWAELRGAREAALGTYRESEPARDSDMAKPALASIRVLARSQSIRPSMKPGDAPSPSIMSLPPDDDIVNLPIERVISPAAGLVAAGTCATLLLGLLGALAASGPFRSAPIVALELLALAGTAAVAWFARTWLFELALGIEPEGSSPSPTATHAPMASISALLPVKPVTQPRIVDVDDVVDEQRGVDESAGKSVDLDSTSGQAEADSAANDNANTAESSDAEAPETTASSANGAEAAIAAALSQGAGADEPPKKRWGRKRGQSGGDLRDPSIPRAPAMPQWSRPPFTPSTAPNASFAHAPTALALSAPPQPQPAPEPKQVPEAAPQNDVIAAPQSGPAPTPHVDSTPYSTPKVEDSNEDSGPRPKRQWRESLKAPEQQDPNATEALRSLTTMPAPQPMFGPKTRLEYEKEQSASASSKTVLDEVVTTARKYSVMSLEPVRFERESRRQDHVGLPSDLPTVAPPSSETERLEAQANPSSEPPTTMRASESDRPEAPQTNQEPAPKPVSNSPVRHSIDPYAAQAYGSRSSRPGRRAVAQRSVEGSEVIDAASAAKDPPPNEEAPSEPETRQWSPWLDGDDGPANGW